MQKVDLPTSFTKLNENCGLPDIFTNYQIRHLGNPSGLPENLLKIDPWPTFQFVTKTLIFRSTILLLPNPIYIYETHLHAGYKYTGFVASRSETESKNTKMSSYVLVLKNRIIR